MTSQACCCCFSFRAGCLIVGVLGILLELKYIESGWREYSSIVGILSNGLLIVGAVTKMRFCLLPSMIIYVLLFLFLCILVSASFFSTTLLNLLLSTLSKHTQRVSYGIGLRPQDDANPAKAKMLVLVIGLCLVGAIINVFILRALFGFFFELREQAHRSNTADQELPGRFASFSSDHSNRGIRYQHERNMVWASLMLLYVFVKLTMTVPTYAFSARARLLPYHRLRSMKSPSCHTRDKNGVCHEYVCWMYCIWSTAKK